MITEKAICPSCGTEVTVSSNGRTTCPECGYVVKEDDPDEQPRGFY